MKIIRYQDSSGQIGFAAQQPDGSAKVISGDILGKYEVTSQTANVAKLLAPIVPTQILCIGLNYRHHATETNAKIPEYPILFIKQLGALQNPNDPIEIPTHAKSDEVDYECELAVVIGKSCKNVTKEDALKYVLGYTCANDVSARDWQIKRGGSQWCRGKSFDTFCPLGPCLVTADEITDPNQLTISTTVNGTKLQDWTTSDMIFDVPSLIAFLSASATLAPGTVILTGTPHGVGMAMKPPKWLAAGDTVTVEIERIGKLTNPVMLEK